MSIYSDKLAHVQVVINCRYSVAQMCTHEDTLTHYSVAQMCTCEYMFAHYLGGPFSDDVLRQDMLITFC